MNKTPILLLLLSFLISCSCSAFVFAHNYPDYNDPTSSAYCNSQTCNNLRKEMKVLKLKEKKVKVEINRLISTYKDPFIYDIAQKMNTKKAQRDTIKSVSEYFEIQEEINKLEEEMLTKLRKKYSEFDKTLQELEHYRSRGTLLKNKLEQAATDDQAKDFLSDKNLNLLKAIQNQDIKTPSEDPVFEEK